jgi:N-acetylated-alpha-linked acidic dipeptidase
MRVRLLAVALFLATAAHSGNTPAVSDSILGFTAAGAKSEAATETKFKAMISPGSARDFHRIFTAEPHPAGSERNNELAKYVAETWKKQGLEDVTIHEYDVLTGYPKELALEMVSPIQYKAVLREQPIGVDPDTKNPNVKPGYAGLSASGEVTAPIVYAHSGNPEDYEILRKAGIDVRGKVVLVRYSNPYSYRGFKALTAQKAGAAAILIYSDPAEDGYKKGKVFPDGPWGPEYHIQRGAITYDFMVAGDPLTPGWASVPGAKHIKPEDAVSLPKIMAMPLSWHDAKPLLEHMGGPKAPKDWQGGLPITYRLGGQGKVHVKIDMDTRSLPNYVVEARIRGAELPDEWVLLGNHRDAWEFGGVDPSSGTASMMEMTRGFGELLKQGVRPRRTIVICSWDGEEVGLTGSTEWGEQFADELQKKLVAYINVDSSTSGSDFEGTAIGSLAPMLVETTKSLQDPKTGLSLYEAWKLSAAQARKEAAAGSMLPGARGAGLPNAPITDQDLVDTRIGSGSDHTVFLNHLGRPTMLLEFDGPYGVYHSMYDDFYWMNHFGDPGYRYHALMSQLWGVVGMRLANADLQPFDFAMYAQNIREWVDEVGKKPGAAANVKLDRLRHKLGVFGAAGDALDHAMADALAHGKLDPQTAASVNAKIMQVESNWLNPDGIPGRPWFKHTLYASRYTYAHLELPGITEAVERQDWKTAQQQVEVLEQQVAKNTALLDAAAAELKQ